MCGSMADIQSAVAEIRRGKKGRRKKKNKPEHENIYGLPYSIGQTIIMKTGRSCRAQTLELFVVLIFVWHFRNQNIFENWTKRWCGCRSQQLYTCQLVDCWSVLYQWQFCQLRSCSSRHTSNEKRRKIMKMERSCNQCKCRCKCACVDVCVRQMRWRRTMRSALCHWARNTALNLWA